MSGRGSCFMICEVLASILTPQKCRASGRARPRSTTATAYAWLPAAGCLVLVTRDPHPTALTTAWLTGEYQPSKLRKRSFDVYILSGL